MSFSCVVTAKQHTKKLISEVCAPQNAIQRPSRAVNGGRPVAGCKRGASVTQAIALRSL